MDRDHDYMWASPQAANPSVAAAPCKQRGYEGTHMSTLHLLHSKTFNSQIYWNTPEDSTQTALIPLENRFKRITKNPRIHTPNLQLLLPIKYGVQYGRHPELRPRRPNHARNCQTLLNFPSTRHSKRHQAVECPLVIPFSHSIAH
jgi:hypothetical protein